jgi:23S rRNA (guanosine2251-2'-O)-methyltransferase
VTTEENPLVVGPYAIEKALESGRPLHKVFLQQSEKQRLKELNRKLKAAQVPVAYVPREKLDRMTRIPHQGAVGQGSPIALQRLASWLPELHQRRRQPLLLLLDGVTDVRNLGAIARSALGLGCDGLVVPESGSAALNEEAVKASAGALMQLPVCREPHLVDAVHYLQAEGYLIAACTEHAHTEWEIIAADQPLAVLIGSEGHGIQQRLLKLSGFKGRIPIYGGIGSLNVSVAAAIALYVVHRQRRRDR